MLLRSVCAQILSGFASVAVSRCCPLLVLSPSEAYEAVQPRGLDQCTFPSKSQNNPACCLSQGGIYLKRMLSLRAW